MQPARIHPNEVFDSSKYNAMSEMSKGSNLETKNVEPLAGTQRTTNSMKPKQIDNKSITRTDAATSAVEETTPKITPMICRRKSQNDKGSKRGRDTSPLVFIYTIIIIIIIITVPSIRKREEVYPISQYHAFNRKCCD